MFYIFRSSDFVDDFYLSQRELTKGNVKGINDLNIFNEISIVAKLES